CGERFRAVDIEQAPLRLLWESRKGAWEEGDLVLLGRFWNLEGIRTGGCAITGGPGLLPASALGPLSALGAGVTAGIWLVWCLAWGLVRSLVIRRILLGWARGIILVLVLVVLSIVRILLIRRRGIYRFLR